MVIRETCIDRIRGTDDLAGQSHPRPCLTRCTRQKPCRTDIGHVTDPGFRHRKLRPFGNDPVLSMRRDPDAATHDDAVHHCHIGFGITRDRVVDRKFLAPEPGNFRIIGLAELIDGPDITAGAKPTLALTHQDNAGNLRTPGEALHRRLHRMHHGKVEAVQRLRPVEPDDRRRPDAVEKDFVGLNCAVAHACLRMSLTVPDHNGRQSGEARQNIGPDCRIGEIDGAKAPA
ncbi:hypothetical protein D3C71_409570 [compost metagenome]